MQVVGTLEEELAAELPLLEAPDALEPLLLPPPEFEPALVPLAATPFLDIVTIADLT